MMGKYDTGHLQLDVCLEPKGGELIFFTLSLEVVYICTEVCLGQKLKCFSMNDRTKKFRKRTCGENIQIQEINTLGEKEWRKVRH
jgi:hypothetical protein